MMQVTIIECHHLYSLGWQICFCMAIFYEFGCCPKEYTDLSPDVLDCTMYIPSDLEISLGPRDFPQARASVYFLVVRDVKPNTSLLSVVHI